MATDIADWDMRPYYPADHERKEPVDALPGGGDAVRIALERFPDATDLRAFSVNVESGGYVTTDSGEREDFDTGSRRDTQEGKPRYDLVSSRATKREALLMARGADKYGERNWEKGQPMARAFASLLRHAYAYWEGEDSEDHLAAIRFGAGLLIDHEERIATGELPESLYDLPYRRRK